jgi:hypothetical protein
VAWLIYGFWVFAVVGGRVDDGGLVGVGREVGFVGGGGWMDGCCGKCGMRFGRCSYFFYLYFNFFKATISCFSKHPYHSDRSQTSNLMARRSSFSKPLS